MAQSDRPRQMPLDLGHGQAMSRDDLVVNSANHAAAAFIEAWPDWPSKTALLVGPSGSGKTHLATIWLEGSNGVPVTNENIENLLSEQQPEDLAWLVEDIDRNVLSEDQLFHLLNHAKQSGAFLLMTSRAAPNELDTKLPDLASRLKAAALCAISEPDDGLLGAVITKLFADRQVSIDPAVVTYMTARMERSLSAAKKAVDTIDSLALEKKSRITKQLAGMALESLERD